MLASRADEVLVRAAVAGILAIDEPTGTASVLARPAVEQALEVVEVDDVAIAFAIAVVQHLLHLQECLLGDEGLVPADVQAAFVADDAGVVGVAQYEREATAAHCLSRSGR
ncbi:MAG: hypothetical protein CMH38_12410 [Microbacterium sp.]|nr:hypothetical protein [Microbacterium sp.]HBR89661.1 hypothetical protein [Microbacterium sp.]HBS75935.1 hypothetical protein [Microbacterium sp.]